MKATLMKLEEDFHSKVEDTTAGMEEFVREEILPQPAAATMEGGNTEELQPSDIHN